MQGQQNIKKGVILLYNIWWHYYQTYGPGSVVDIVTAYRLDGLGIKSRWGGEIFCTSPDRP